MNKAKITMYVTIICISIILVSVSMMRFKVVDNTDLELEEGLIETELRQELASWKEKYNEALEELESINSKIKEYEEQIGKNEDTSGLVASELKQTANLLGKTKVKGDGVIITLEDNDEEKILESDLSEIVNELKYAGAEAISINDIRLGTMTDVSSTSDNVIILNGQRISSPYIVKAIRKSNLPL